MSNEIELTDGQIVLRPVVLDAVDGISEAAMETVSELQRWFPWCNADYSRDEVIQWVNLQPDNRTEDREWAFTICELDDPKILGIAGMNHINRLGVPSANLGYWIRKSAMGRGIATAATKLVATFGIEKLDLHRIEIVAAVSNPGSCRVAEKAGATREGIARNRTLEYGEYVDSVMYSLIPSDF